MNVGGHLDTFSSGFTPTSFPFIGIKRKMRAKNEHATFHHGDTMSSSEQRESSPSKRIRPPSPEELDPVGFRRAEMQRRGYANSAPMPTFQVDGGSSLEDPPWNEVPDPYFSSGKYVQLSDTDEKSEDWPADLLTELNGACDRYSRSLAKSPSREEGSPIVNGDNPVRENTQS